MHLGGAGATFQDVPTTLRTLNLLSSTILHPSSSITSRCMHFTASTHATTISEYTHHYEGPTDPKECRYPILARVNNKYRYQRTGSTPLGPNRVNYRRISQDDTSWLSCVYCLSSTRPHSQLFVIVVVPKDGNKRSTPVMVDNSDIFAESVSFIIPKSIADKQDHLHTKV